MSSAETAGIQLVHHRGAVDSLYFGDMVLLYYHVDCPGQRSSRKVCRLSCGVWSCHDDCFKMLPHAYCCDFS